MNKRKASGPDKISNWILCECAEELCEPMQIIYQKPIEQGKLPDIGEMGWSGQGGSVWTGRGGDPSAVAIPFGGRFRRKGGVGTID